MADSETVLARTIDEKPHSQADVREYFGPDRSTGTAIHVSRVREDATPVSREHIERVVPEFVPPQNFRDITLAQYEHLSREGR